ncbi:MAG: DUF4349 domain-containing protein [Ilumatobacteraceae bacterium]
MGNNDTELDRRTATRRGRPRQAAMIVGLAGIVALTACSGNDDDSSAESTQATAEATADMSDSYGDQSTRADEPGFVESAREGAENPERFPIDSGFDSKFDIGVIGRDVIIEMRVVVSSDDIQRTVASVMASASTLGGGVASSEVDYGGGDDVNEGFAVLVVKVPPQAVDRLLAGLDDTGEVQSINQNAQDVTEQLVNLDIRIANARASVDNVRTFMDRTENLNELVTLEAELTRRLTDLEQLEAQQRNIADLVALSTITIEVVPTASVPDQAPLEDESIGRALRTGWNAFARFGFGIAIVLATTLPFLGIALVVALALWMWMRRRATRPTGSPMSEPNGHADRDDRNDPDGGDFGDGDPEGDPDGDPSRTSGRRPQPVG